VYDSNLERTPYILVILSSRFILLLLCFVTMFGNMFNVFFAIEDILKPGFSLTELNWFK